MREVDGILCIMQSLRYKYVSYRQTTVQDRLVAMYNNGMKNGYRKYEILENIKLNDKILEEIKDEYILLETVLIEAEKGEKSYY